MKKWSEPEVFDLSLKETKGGPKITNEADGDAVYDQGTNKWWVPVGQS